MRLFCFPHAGGTADLFTRWIKIIDPAIDLVFVQYPGRASRFREPPIVSMQSMVSRLAEALAPMFDRPFAFFGHSMGALIAFELARSIDARGAGLERLFLSACPAPQRVKPLRHAQSMTDQEVTDLLTSMGGTPPAVLENAELLRLVIPFVRSDFELVDSYPYRPGPRLKIPFSLCFGSSDPETDPVDTGLWGELTEAECVKRIFEGDHFFINTEASGIAGWISAALLPQTATTLCKES